MIEKYNDLKKIYYKTEKEYILIYYLKKMNNYLKECKVIEVLSDDNEAFEHRFCHIIKFVTESYIYKPQKRLITHEGQEREEFAMCYSLEKNVRFQIY